VLRSASFAAVPQLMQLADGHEGNGLVSREVLPGLLACVVIDTPEAMAMLSYKTMSDWGVAEDVVFARAERNLMALAAGNSTVEPYDPEAAYPTWIVSTHDDHESSRLLAPGWLAAFRGKVRGNPVAVVPDRSTLIIGGDADVACIERLLSAAEKQYASSRRSISFAPYTLDESDKLVPLAVPSDHALFGAVSLAHAQLAQATYQDNLAELREHYGEDLFVASFSVVQGDDGEVWSYGVWTKDVDTLLPKASHVVLLDPEKDEHKRVPWSEIEAHLTPNHDVLPTRYRTGAWPTAFL
jgi:hypothetical protein